MINEYTKGLTAKNAEFNLPKKLIEMQSEYRSEGVPTILTDGLNELLLICAIKKPKRILELGTATGCSAIALLLNNPSATLVTVEKNHDIRLKAIENFKLFGVEDRVTSLIGDSLDVVMHMDEKFDFVFMDCNKAAYSSLFPLVKDMLNPGGVIFTDNILFRGYVAKEHECPNDYRTLVSKIDEFNKIAANDKDFITCFFDVGDGIAVSCKKE